MTSLFQRLDEEEALVRGELSALRERTTAAEERLARLTITRETASSLLGDGIAEDPGAEPEESVRVPRPGNSPHDSVSSSASGDGARSDASAPPADPMGWEVARERMLVLLAGAGRAMKVQDICAAIGEDITNARRVETTRSRLKRLAKEGRVTEGPTAYFAIAPTGSGHRQEGAGMR